MPSRSTRNVASANTAKASGAGSQDNDNPPPAWSVTQADDVYYRPISLPDELDEEEVPEFVRNIENRPKRRAVHWPWGRPIPKADLNELWLGWDRCVRLRLSDDVAIQLRKRLIRVEIIKEEDWDNQLRKFLARWREFKPPDRS